MILEDNVSGEQESPIYLHYLNHGGAAGALGTPIGGEEEVVDGRGVAGRRQHFRGTLYGTEHSVALLIPAERARFSCHRPDYSGTPLESTIAWSAETGAHVVHGEIRRLWLELGGESGHLGYPISDEMPTPDGRGRRNQFQFGEIWWFLETGAYVRGDDRSGPPNRS